MTDPTQQVAELLSVPLEQLLSALGRGIGEAQSALDRHSIEIQQMIDDDPVLGQYGLTATWYQIPSTELDLRIAVAVEQPPETGGPAVPRIWAQPVNARYANQFGYDVQASSSVRLTVVPVPPPAVVTAVRAVHSAEEVVAAVRTRLVDDDTGVRGRVSVNFSPPERSWIVLQTEGEGTSAQRLKLLRVDDETLTVTREDPAEG
ncbi:hypothetical protein [Actinoplanes sp. NPDC049265]|uniref:hypothetical protein n=1 Tax=Actinoplanes sp. NPDC049265 TaxID=3363902 RepID=UPI003723C669